MRHYVPDATATASILIACLVLIPLGVIFSSVFEPGNGVWRHLVDTLLAELLLNTFWLVAGVGLGTFWLGVSLAWLTAAYEFPGRKIFDWALMLPLALPTYVIAFVAIGLLEFTGPVQGLLREWLGAERIWFPQIRSAGGVILVMTLALYPYVYLLARNAFLTQGRRAMEAARSLGHGQWTSFTRVSLPMAWPWIAGGLALALMETLADFGAVSIFNYDTFTTAVYKAWFGMFSLSAAAQLSSLLILIVFVVLLVEQQLRSRHRFVQVGKASTQADRILLTGPGRWLVASYCAAVLALGFIIPVGQLVLWALGVVDQDLDSRYLGFLSHSLLLGAMASLLTVGCAMLLAYSIRGRRSVVSRVVVRLATLGYAVPGVVLAVGIFIAVASVDRAIIDAVRSFWGLEIGLVLTGTVAVMLLAYVIRFMAVAYNPIESAMQRVTMNIDEAARTLGCSGLKLLGRVHFPILRRGVMTAAILVFVDVMKEMPITLMTRPFGWDTLSVRIFEMTAEGEWERAALPAVALLMVGLIPIILLSRSSRGG